MNIPSPSPAVLRTEGVDGNIHTNWLDINRMPLCSEPLKYVLSEIPPPYPLEIPGVIPLRRSQIDLLLTFAPPALLALEPLDVFAC